MVGMFFAAQCQQKINLDSPVVVGDLYTSIVNDTGMAAYAPTWGHGSAIGNADSKFRKIPSYIDKVLIAFVVPDLPPWNPTAPLSDSGFDFGPSITAEMLRSDIQEMQSQNKTVFLSVGGATYAKALPAIEAEAELILEGGELNATTAPKIFALADMASYFNCGLDIDWEDLAVPFTSEAYYRLYLFSMAIRIAMDESTSSNKRVAIASFSTSWDNTALINANKSTFKRAGGAVSWYAGNAGQCRGAASFEHDNGISGQRSRGDFLDFIDEIFIMSYDVGNLTTDRYSAETAYLDCIDVLTQAGKTEIPISIGIEPPPEGAGTATLMVNTADAVEEASIMRQNSYSETVNVPHAVEYYAGLIDIQRQGSRSNDSIMMWSLWKSMGGLVNSVSGAPYATPTTAGRKVAEVLGLNDSTANIDA